MARRVHTRDVFAAVVPQGIDTTNLQEVIPELFPLAQAYVAAQWRYVTPRPVLVENLDADWLITNRLSEVEEFRPVHDCAACRAGNDQVAAFLRENPDRFVALANLQYTEVWES